MCLTNWQELHLPHRHPGHREPGSHVEGLVSRVLCSAFLPLLCPSTEGAPDPGVGPFWFCLADAAIQQQRKLGQSCRKLTFEWEDKHPAVLQQEVPQAVAAQQLPQVSGTKEPPVSKAKAQNGAITICTETATYQSMRMEKKRHTTWGQICFTSGI